MAEFLRSTTSIIVEITGLIAAISGLIGVIINIAIVIKGRDRKDDKIDEIEPPEIPNPPIKITAMSVYIFFLITGILAFGSIRVGKAFIPPPPLVEIDPIPNNQVDLSLYKPTGAGSFIITGGSSGVYSNQNLRIYVLVHPTEPSAPGWYVQRPVTPGKDGAWQLEVWHGGGTLQPQSGHKLQIVAAVAPALEIEGYKRVNDIVDIAPVAQSRARTISIASLK
jgi:hypothetical protein